ncbi:hypothetical protein A3F08_01400 [Candidatus Berkelbacteria bacterium RIFCSPHIGHO2_12_FULL_36_9]|uniref:DNA 3'-5' helicase n=1 Tax=Candidatus Berkelbacteria bacterium RIFCSPHIGHO2_12_FULL_36_9 TaxID=1797469 RepID=A0A1F5EK64_9BACT|nr:MAG: hypothetical protein A3F08_01400 [Candidatus Berkelbacteria bacterium RIFCSPHIGHO2_12_FULL_36_9]
MALKSKLLNNLNKEQIQAVTHKNGPLLIIAGAGTGKTTVIAKRVAYLIENDFAKPSEILALTFTEKAAKEMDERILEILPYGVLDFTAKTFHSFCQDILKDYGINAGISPDFKLLTESQQILFIKQHFDEFKLDLYKPISNPDKFISALIKLFSRAKDEIVSVENYKVFTKKYEKIIQKKPLEPELIENYQAIKEQALAYETYEKLKEKNSYFDFGDLIEKTLWLLRNRAHILKKIQNKYKYIFVDEFQDTNYAQAQVAYLIASKYKNITAVGDDDQAIYAFRGAAISNMMEFVKHYTNVKKVTLVRNYRSTKQILDQSYKLITNNNPERLEVKEKVNKKLLTDKKGLQPMFWHFSSGYAEIEATVKYILNFVEQKKNIFGDFAILVRANSHADDFITLFKDNGIPYHFIGSRGLYDRDEIRELRSYLKVLYNPDDNLSLFHVAWANQYKIDKILLRRLTNIAKEKNISLFDIISTPVNYIECDEQSKKSMSKIVNLIKKHLELSKTLNTSKILIDYIQKSGMYDLFKNIESYRQEEIFENIKIFFSKIAEFENISENKSLFEFVDYLDLIIETGDNPSVFEAEKYEDAVNIMTVHAAKGLEFDTVFMPYLVDGRFPSRDRKDPIELPDELVKEKIPSGDINIQEERRLFYVAMTRTKNTLVLSASDKYAANKEEKKISRFIYEIFEKNEIDKYQKSECDFIQEKMPFESPTAKKKNQPIILSPSNLETFNDCPKKFEYGYVFRLSGEATQSLSFGDSIHNTLRDYYQLLISGEKMIKKKIEDIYQKNWKVDGYSSRMEMDRAYKKGHTALLTFIKNDQEKPVAIEKTFQLKLGNCELKGRIDRVNRNKDTEIIDYKTGDGRKKTQSEITKNIPLWIYAIYLSKKLNPESLTLTLNFIINQKNISAKVTKEKLSKKTKQISNLCNEISTAVNNHDFPAKPTEFNCGYCHFKNICPYKYKRV